MQLHTHGNTKHGNARRGMKTKTYKTWESMHRRCYMPSQDSYPEYGGSGIEVCERWYKFENFLEDMGEQPDGMSIERNDISKNYSHENCKWVPLLRQARNKRTTRWLTFNGETMCLADWADRLGIKPKTLRARLDDHGWSLERALTTGVMTSSESSFVAREVRYGRLKKKTATSASTSSA